MLIIISELLMIHNENAGLQMLTDEILNIDAGWTLEELLSTESITSLTCLNLNDKPYGALWSNVKLCGIGKNFTGFVLS